MDNHTDYSNYSKFIDTKAEIAGLAVILFTMAVATVGIALTWQHVTAIAFGCVTLVGAKKYRGVSIAQLSVSETAGEEGE